MSEITPSQTVGPYFAYGLTPTGRCEWKPNDAYAWKQTIGDNLVTPDAIGERIRIEGCIRDGDGVPIPDAMLEIWQADGQGRYAGGAEGGARSNAAFKGHGRSATDKNGVFAFDTVKPGPVPAPGGGMQAPHVLVAVFARGMLRQVHTRLYFEGEAGNAADPILALVPAERRDTLIAKKDGATWRFDIHMQGDGETVFFDV
jgi:protocatechuate 3,4-dioxygenase alpha subunit